MDGLAFEHFVAKLLRQRGYRAEVTQASGDFGVDIIARKGRRSIAIQVKRYKGSVARHAISDAVAGKYHWKCNEAWVITNSYFTKDAHELARSTQCRLIDRDELARWLEPGVAAAIPPLWRPVVLIFTLTLLLWGLLWGGWQVRENDWLGRGWQPVQIQLQRRWSDVRALFQTDESAESASNSVTSSPPSSTAPGVLRSSPIQLETGSPYQVRCIRQNDGTTLCTIE